MKKVILFVLFLGVVTLICTPAMAKKESGALPAPTNLTADLKSDSICFSWDPVEEAAKYSLDVDVTVNMDGTDRVVEFSFGTSDRTDDLNPSAPNLCVPLASFVFDLDGDGVLDQVFGPAHIKVKALNPGEDTERQNNAFSAGIDSTL